MSVVTVYKFEGMVNPWRIAKALHGRKLNDNWLTAFVSKYNRSEVVINYWSYEDVEDGIKRVFDENESMEIVTYLKQNGKTRILKRLYCFINTMTKTLEIYIGADAVLDEIVTMLENLLQIKFDRVVLTSKDLQSIYSQHSNELKQAMFKNVEGLFYEILRGNNLESNKKFNEYMQKFSDCLRVISFRPKIKFLNGYNRYQVTINADKGTLKFYSPNEKFDFRPRMEIRQLTFLVAATLGLFR